MRNTFGTAEYLAGSQYSDPNKPPEEDTEKRTWGQTFVDTAADVLGPTVGIGRTITHAVRAGTDYLPQVQEATGIDMKPVQDYLGTSAEGRARDVDVAVGGVEKAINDWHSPYSKSVGEASLVPGYGERSFWDTPLASSGKLAAGMVPYAALALATGGESIAGQVTGMAIQGGFGAAEGWNQLQDYTDQTPLDKLRKESPVFADYERQFPGNEKAARQALYKDTVDLKAMLASGVANAAEFGALLDGMNTTQKKLAIGMARFIPGIGKFIGKGRVAGAVGGTLEGVLSGGAEGATDNYIEQVAKVRRGEQEAINVSEIPKGFWQGAALGPGVGAWHAIHPKPLSEWNKDVQSTLNQQLAPGQFGPPTQGGSFAPTPPPPPGTPPAGGAPGAPPPGGVAPPPGGGAAPPPGGAVAPPPTGGAPPPVGGGPGPGAAPPIAGGEGAPTPPVAGEAPPVAPLDRAPVMADDRIPPPPDSAVAQFTTAKGSQYWQFEDGTTIRNKAARPEHPGDAGFKEQSQQTFFVTPEHADQMGSLMQATSRFSKQMAQNPRTGQWGVQYTSGPSAGKWERRTMGTVSPTPQVGMHPVEIWKGGRRFHFGNAITNVKNLQRTGAATAPTAPATTAATLPASKAPGEAEAVGPPSQPPGPATWHTEDGYQHDVEVVPGFPPEQGEDGRLHQRVMMADGQQAFVPADELRDRVREPHPNPKVEAARTAFEDFERKAHPREMMQPGWREKSDALYNTWQDEMMRDRREAAGLMREPPVVGAQPPPVKRRPDVRAALPKAPTDISPRVRQRLRLAMRNIDPVRREAWADLLASTLKRVKGRRLARGEVPEGLRRSLDEEQLADLRDGLATFPAQTIAEVRETPLDQENVVLQDIRSRQGPPRQITPTAPAIDRAEIQKDINALEAEVRGYQVDRKKTAGRWIVLRRQARFLDDELRNAGMQPRFVQMLGPRPGRQVETIRREGAADRIRARRAGRKAGWPDPDPNSKLTASEQIDEQSFADDVQKYHQRIDALRQRDQEAATVLSKSFGEGVPLKGRETLVAPVRPRNYGEGDKSAEDREYDRDKARYDKLKSEYAADDAARAKERDQLQRVSDALRKRAIKLDQIRRKNDMDDPFATAVTAFTSGPPKKQSSAERFNTLVKQLAPMEGMDAASFIRQAQPQLQEMVRINNSRSAYGVRTMPTPRWIHDRLRIALDTSGFSSHVVTYRNAQRIYDSLKEGRENYDRAYRWYTRARHARGPLTSALAEPARGEGGEISTETYEPEARRDRAAYRALSPAAKRKLKRDAATAVGQQPAQAHVTEERAREALARREELARQRLEGGKPMLRPGERLPTEAELLAAIRKSGTSTSSHQERMANLRAAYTENREAEYKLVMAEAIQKRFGTTQRMRDFLIRLYELSSIVRPPLPDALKHRGDVEIQVPTRQFAIPMTLEEAEARARTGTPSTAVEIPLSPQEQRQRAEDFRNARRDTEHPEVLRRVTQKWADRERPIQETPEQRQAREAGLTPQAKRIARRRISQQVLNKHKERMEKYWEKKTEQYKLAQQLGTFLSHFVDKSQSHIESYMRKHGIEGTTITWKLPEALKQRKLIPPGQDPTSAIMSVMGKKSYQVGVNTEENDYYNMATEMLKMSETLRYIIDNVEAQKGKKVLQGSRQLTEEEKRRRYMAPLNPTSVTAESAGPLADFVLNMHSLLEAVDAGTDTDAAATAMTKIRDFRAARSGATTGKYLELPTPPTEMGKAAQEYRDAIIAQQAEIPDVLLQGGQKGTTADELARNVFDAKRQELAAEAEKVKARGSNRTLEQIKQQLAEDKAAVVKEQFPLAPARKPFTGVPRKTSIGTRPISMPPIQQKMPPLPAKEQAVWDQYDKASIEEMLTPGTDGRYDGESRVAASYAIDEKGQLHNVNDHGGHVHNILSARDDMEGLGDDHEASAEDNHLLEENPDSGRPYVHISRYSDSGLLSFGIDHSSSITRQQAATIRRFVAEAQKAQRAGAEIDVQMAFQKLAAGYDAGGLPADRMPKRTAKPDEQGTPEWNKNAAEERMDEAWSELNQGGEPSHPLISQPETTRDVLNRLADMVERGEIKNLPREYITPQLLDQLATITTGTSVYHAPYDAVSNVGVDAPGYYNVTNDRVVVSADVHPEYYAQVVMHETGHAATNAMMSRDRRFVETMRDLLIKAVQKAKADGINLNALPNKFYGLTHVNEFVQEIIANKAFRDWLSTVQTPEHPVIHGVKNALNAAYRAIRDAFRRLMGHYNANTALDVLFHDQSNVLGRADRLIQSRLSKMMRTGRPAFVPEHIQHGMFRPGIEVPGVDRLYIGRGARAFADDMADGFDRTRKRVAYHLRSDRNRARGLKWQTTFDMTQMGSPEFRKLTENTFETMEKIFAMGSHLRDVDRRELHAIAKIYNNWGREARQDVAQFSLDLTMHGAFTDVALDDPKNKFVDRDSMAWEQVVQEHPKMMDRHRDLQQLEGFDEFLSRILKFGAAHEEEIRRARLRDLIKFSSLVPDHLLPGMPEHDRLVDAVERLINLEPDRDIDGKAKPVTAAWIQQHMSQADANLIAQHVDHNDPVTKEIIRDLHNVPDIQRLPGPYLPLTRQGDWALSGEFTLPEAPNGIQLPGDINRLTGEPIDEGKVAFKTKEEAQAYVAKVTKELGITQTGGGRVMIDADTGNRPMVRPGERKTKKLSTRDPTKRALRAGENVKPTKLVLANEAQIKEMIDNGQNIQPYYYVQFQRKLLTMHANEFEAQQAYNEFQQKFGDRLKLTEPKDVMQYDARQNEQYVSTAMQKLINHMRQSDAYKRLGEAEQSALTRVMTLASETYAMRRGVRQRYLPRGYVEGASRNTMQSLDDYSAMATHYQAKVEHASELAVNSKAQKDYITGHQYEQGDKNYLVNQRVYAAMQRRIHSPKMNPRDTMLNRNIDRALRLTMLDKLPSIGYFTVNATEPVAVAAPLMMGRHNPLRVASAMWQMYKIFGLTKMLKNAGKDMAEAFVKGSDKIDYLDEMKKAIDASKLDEIHKIGLKAMLERGAMRGIFDRSGNIEYQGAFSDNANMVDRAADWAQGVFQGANTAVEAMNRFVTLGSAYMLEVNKGSSHEDAMKYAFRISHAANGQYANYNSPEAFNSGPVARMVTQFKKYPQRIMMNYIRGAQGAIGLLKGDRSPENIERARQLAALLAVQFLLAGALGLPTELFAVPLNTLHFLGFTKYSSADVSNGFRQWAANTFGVQGGAAASKGLLSVLTGLDFHGRMSQAQMFSSGPPRSTKPQDLPAILAGFFFGASASTGVELAQAAQYATEGATALAQGADDVAVHNFMKFGEKIVLFRTFADLMAAANGMSAEGQRGPSGRQRAQPYGPVEALARAGGFRPFRESEGTEAAIAVRQAADRQKAERKAFTDRWVQSPPAQQQKMWPSVQAWNEGKPRELQLTREELLKAQQTRTKAERQTLDKLGLSVDRQTKPFLPMAKAYATGG